MCIRDRSLSAQAQHWQQSGEKRPSKPAEWMRWFHHTNYNLFYAFQLLLRVQPTSVIIWRNVLSRYLQCGSHLLWDGGISLEMSPRIKEIGPFWCSFEIYWWNIPKYHRFMPFQSRWGQNWDLMFGGSGMSDFEAKGGSCEVENTSCSEWSTGLYRRGSSRR